MNDRALHGDMNTDGDLIEHPWDELCPRCTVPMAWIHQAFQCRRCHLKFGCCTGE